MDFKAYWAKAKTLGITAIVAGALTLTLAACGGDANTGSATATTGSTGTNPTATTATGGGGAVDTPVGGKINSVSVKLDEWTIQPPNVQIPPGSTTFVATNEGEFSHNFVLQKDGTDVGGTPVFSAGDSPKEITLDLQPGTYTTLCTVPGHAQKGMTGKLTVAP